MKIQKYKTFEAAEHNEKVPNIKDLLFDFDLEEFKEYFVEVEDVGAEIEYRIILANKSGSMVTNFESEEMRLGLCAEIINTYFSDQAFVFLEISIDDTDLFSSSSIYSEEDSLEKFINNDADIDEKINFAKACLLAVSRLRKKYFVDWNVFTDEQKIRVKLETKQENIEEKKRIAREILNYLIKKDQHDVINQILNSVILDYRRSSSKTISDKYISYWRWFTAETLAKHDHERYLIFDSTLQRRSLTFYLNKLKNKYPFTKISTLDQSQAKALSTSSYAKEYLRVHKNGVVMIKIEIPEDKIDEVVKSELNNNVLTALKITKPK